MSLEQLNKAIAQNKIAGAGLDVLENEKLATYAAAQQEQLQNLLPTLIPMELLLRQHILQSTQQEKCMVGAMELMV